MTPEPSNLSSTNIGPELAAGRPPATVSLLRNDERSEVLWFLAQRPLHGAIMSGLIRDNGVQNEINRGSFYGCRDRAEMLMGVALIGHTTLIEARTGAAIDAFATVAQEFRRIHVIVGEDPTVTRFWQTYRGNGQLRRRQCAEILFALDHPPKTFGAAYGLRVAAACDLSAVTEAHAAMAFAESGVDPLQIDPEAFRTRCLRRIQQRRVWVCSEHDRMLFKADVISETPEVAYLEGIYVHPADRGKGNGSRYVAELSRILLRQTNSVTALVNATRSDAQRLLQRIGFAASGLYQTIFLEAESELKQ